MAFSADFISWDDEDLNLDLLLGEYTDEDTRSCNTMTNDEKIMPQSDQTVEYTCPECSKTLRSISGFRGHVTKKHGLNVKGEKIL